MNIDSLSASNHRHKVDTTLQEKLDSIIFYDSSYNESLLRILKEIQEDEKKLLGMVDYDTLFTVSVTIFIFFLGIVADRCLKYRDLKNEQKSIRIYFKTYLDKISENTAPRLSKMYKEFYQEININTGIPTTPPKILTGDFNRISNIDSKSLFHSINEKEFLSKLLSRIDFIERVIIEISTYHIQALKDSDFYRSPMQDLLDAYTMRLSDFLEFLRKNDLEEKYDDFRKLLNDSIFYYHEEIVPNNDLKKLYKEIIRPIQIYMVQNRLFRIKEIEEEANQIMVLGKDLSHKFNYLRRVTVDVKITYRKFSKLLDESSNELKLYKDKIEW